jgi:hypothetical protein
MRAAEARRTVLKNAKNEWWKLEVEMLLAEMRNIMAKMKTQSSNM